MLKIKAFDNFRTFERTEDGEELHMTEEVCYICDKPSEVYIAVELPNIVSLGQMDTSCILFCKTCLSKGEQMWNETFLKHAKRDRQEQEKFLKGE